MNLACRMKLNACPNRNEPVQGMTLGAWLTKARSQLSSLPIEPTSSLRALTAFVLQKANYWPLAHTEHILNTTQLNQLDRNLQRLLSREPLPYIIGKQAFFGLDFLVNSSVLIPRPETELLVSSALEWLKSHPNKRMVADIGTGSGCIAIALAKHNPHITLIATDIAHTSLQVAKQNCRRHSVGNRIALLQCDLMDCLQASFDLICTNLPYIPHEKLKQLEVIRHEPRLALDGGKDGLDQIMRLLEQAPSHLKAGGALLMEIEHTQNEVLKDLIPSFFPDASVTIIHDLNQQPRLARIET